MTNAGVELQLDGRILPAKKRRDLGINLGFNLAYNKNKVTKVSHYPESGAEYLSTSLHEGYPLNSLFSVNYVGLIEKRVFTCWAGRTKKVMSAPSLWEVGLLKWRMQYSRVLIHLPSAVPLHLK